MQRRHRSELSYENVSSKARKRKCTHSVTVYHPWPGRARCSALSSALLRGHKLRVGAMVSYGPVQFHTWLSADREPGLGQTSLARLAHRLHYRPKCRCVCHLDLCLIDCLTAPPDIRQNTDGEDDHPRGGVFWHYWQRKDKDPGQGRVRC